MKLIYDAIPWGELPKKVYRDRWRVLARRLMASGGDDLQEFLHNVVRAVAGDAFYVTRSSNAGSGTEGRPVNAAQQAKAATEGGESRRKLGEELEEFLKKVPDRELQKKIIAYIKDRAIPLVIRLSAQVLEKEGE